MKCHFGKQLYMYTLNLYDVWFTICSKTTTQVKDLSDNVYPCQFFNTYSELSASQTTLQ